jgi:L-lactate dehydrogenase complex protein LldG
VEGEAMSARERILDRVRRAMPGEPAGRTAEAVAWPERVRALTPPHQAQSQGPGRLTQFMTKVSAVSGTVSRVSSMTELPKALAHELRNRNLAATVRTGSEPAFAGLDWGTIEVSRGVGRIEEPATLSKAVLGVAETGTLVLASGPDNPVTLTFLGETHFVVLREADVVGGFEEAWAAWRELGLDPRTVNMVTGPSRSADIGQVLQLGAHGPIALHVFLIAA